MPKMRNYWRVASIINFKIPIKICIFTPKITLKTVSIKVKIFYSDKF